MRYPVVIHKDKDSAYGVTVPDIPGCFSAGDTIDEALENTREAIFAHLELVTQSGGDIPDAHLIQEHVGNKGYAGGTWALVEAKVEDLLGPAERVNITIPKRALQKIDMAAKVVGDTRSGLLKRAVLDFISTDRGIRESNIGAAMSKPMATEGKQVSSVSGKAVSREFQRKSPRASRKKQAADANK